MSNDWDSLSRSEKKEEAQKTLRMLKGKKIHNKIIGYIKVNGIGFILALALFGFMFWFFEVIKPAIKGGLALYGKQYLMGFGLLFGIYLLRRGIRVFYEKYLR